MPRATSPFTRGIIVSNKVEGKTPKQCLEQITLIKQKLGQNNVCSLDTIYRIYKKWDDGDDIQLFKAIENICYNSKKIKLAIGRMYKSLPEKISKIITSKGEQINI